MSFTEREKKIAVMASMRTTTILNVIFGLDLSQTSTVTAATMILNAHTTPNDAEMMEALLETEEFKGVMGEMGRAISKLDERKRENASQANEGLSNWTRNLFKKVEGV